VQQVETLSKYKDIYIICTFMTPEQMCLLPEDRQHKASDEEMKVSDWLSVDRGQCQDE